MTDLLDDYIQEDKSNGTDLAFKVIIAELSLGCLSCMVFNHSQIIQLLMRFLAFLNPFSN